MTWYKEWFNSENYLKVYGHRDETEAERLADLITKELALQHNSSVLDMACGAGRHAIAFAKKGFDVTAVDLSERLISEAKRNGLQAKVKVDFILSDILEFNSSKQFDVAVNLFTSIGYFETDEENFAVIKKAYNLLKQDGHFILDYFNKDFLLNNLVPTSIFSENGLRIIQNRTIEGKRIVKKITFENNNLVNEFYESVRLYSYDEMLNFFLNSGFLISKQYGNYYGNDFERESSPRLIIFAKK